MLSAICTIAGFAFIAWLFIVYPLLAGRHERVNRLAMQALFTEDREDER